jgi:osmotically inducible protein OsmC
MKLSFVLQEGGFNPTELNVTCAINFENGAITNSHLTLKATVPGIDKAKFDAAAADAKANCPISKLLNTDITMEATLA